MGMEVKHRASCIKPCRTNRGVRSCETLETGTPFYQTVGSDLRHGRRMTVAEPAILILLNTYNVEKVNSKKSVRVKRARERDEKERD